MNYSSSVAHLRINHVSFCPILKKDWPCLFLNSKLWNSKSKKWFILRLVIKQCHPNKNSVIDLSQRIQKIEEYIINMIYRQCDHYDDTLTSWISLVLFHHWSLFVITLINLLDIGLKTPFDMTLQLRKLDTGNKNNRKYTWYLNQIRCRCSRWKCRINCMGGMLEGSMITSIMWAAGWRCDHENLHGCLAYITRSFSIHPERRNRRLFTEDLYGQSVCMLWLGHLWVGKLHHWHLCHPCSLGEGKLWIQTC